MAITSRQIGWSQESNILWSISKQLEQIARLGGGGSGTVTGSGVNSQIAFWDAATNITGSNNLFWDNVNKRMGIGTNTPLTTAAGYTVLALNGAVGSGGVLEFQTNGVRIATINNNNLQLDLETKIAGPITFGTNGSERMRIFSGGNVGIGTGATDTGERLQVTGDVKITGSGATSGTTSLRVQNSSATNLLTVQNNGVVSIPLQATIGTIQSAVFGISNTFRFTVSGLRQGGITLDSLFTVDEPSGNINAFAISHKFISATGSFTNTSLLINPTINQTGTSSGISRAIYVNPSITTVVDFRAIETARGNIVFSNLPTSSAGLPAGALWNNGGVVNIV
jgi:hypothetical protein